MADTYQEHGSKQGNHGEGAGCCFFEIHVRGHLGSEWSDWFENLDIRLLDNGETVLSGPIVDQAALMGILNKLNRLNLALLSVNEIQRKDVVEGERNGTTASIESQT